MIFLNLIPERWSRSSFGPLRERSDRRRVLGGDCERGHEVTELHRLGGGSPLLWRQV